MFRIIEYEPPNKLEFKVFRVASMKMAVVWVVTPCSLVDDCRSFRASYFLYHQVDGGI